MTISVDEKGNIFECTFGFSLFSFLTFGCIGCLYDEMMKAQMNIHLGHMITAKLYTPNTMLLM